MCPLRFLTHVIKLLYVLKHFIPLHLLPEIWWGKPGNFLHTEVLVLLFPTSRTIICSGQQHAQWRVATWSNSDQEISAEGFWESLCFPTTGVTPFFLTLFVKQMWCLEEQQPSFNHKVKNIRKKSSHCKDHSYMKETLEEWPWSWTSELPV